MPEFDVAIIGGGIVGLANAWMASRCNLSVAVFERDRVASGASVRNFGMVWPVGQPGELSELAMQSREFWLELQHKANLWVNPCGSLHLAHHQDEQAVLEEFVQQEGKQREIELIPASAIEKHSPAANPEGLLVGMFSPHELCVNPAVAISQISHWLEETASVSFFRNTAVTRVDDGTIKTGAGEKHQAERIVVCSGSDFETLFPTHFAAAGLRKCKLQMLATPKQPNEWALGPHLAGGLTLRHYKSFESCPTHTALKNRIANESPLLDEFGIHVMASQNNNGEVILGDSHVYDDDISPFDSAEIDRLILEELDKLIRLPDFSIERRWHGIYAKHPTRHVLVADPEPNCKIVTATGGAGMTLSFGLAEQIWKHW
ncbi:TIGR03364 family FAD-dependent oxidoreductase [Mariniblastus fucicola]|uniref:Bifunctional tRNA (Mnm(5)s(2)U34)-methyltransferase/FAD-dependent cmnm(5)s(2)U34 oxidoreductase n=1 Tax=Mariniblastus fucicola TaxID=980251 RepID=A0A5B9PNB8_9BACT|nr:TIGR03364 family FAD-dependent oxidoreductase [Mariniblastus fucicola]QEG24031.1 bifunctional tRNA (mnm(5)s(2)U34)-methyltransferase/FAD-dependent cmnm(5)s(2)U34 oxidoreductase [Mariniblastus fucicola]